MALASPDLAKLSPQSLAVLQAIIASDLSDFDKLSAAQKQALTDSAISAGYKTNLEIFYDLKLHPEKIGLPQASSAQQTEITNLNQVIAANLKLYQLDRSSLQKQVDTVFKSRTEKDRQLVQKLIELAVIKKQAEIFALKADKSTKESLQNLALATDPKNPPLPSLNLACRAIVENAAAQAKISLDPSQQNQATAFLITAVVAGYADLSQPDSYNEIANLSLSANPRLKNDLTDLYHQLEDGLVITPMPDYSVTQVTPDLALNLNQIILPAGEIKTPALITLSPTDQDRAEKTQSLAKNFSARILLNTHSDEIMAHLAGTITKEQETQLRAVLLADNLLTRAAPTRQGAAAARVIQSINNTNAYTDAATLRLISMGLAMRNAQDFIAANPQSKTAQYLSQNPSVLRQLSVGSQHLTSDQSPLGREILPHSLSGLSAAYQSATNTLSGFLPGPVGQVFNFVAHPFQFFQNRLGEIVGDRLVGRFKNWLGQKFVSQVANETLKKGAEFLLKNGLQQGVKLLAQQGLRVGLEALLGATGVGLPLAIAVELAFDLGGLLIKPLGAAINGLFRAFTGEDFDARAAFGGLVAAPLAVVGTIGSALAGVGVATAAAASSAAIILLGSVIIGFFLYVAVIAIAPIISGIAQLESGQANPITFVGSGGPVPEGCPSGWPVTSGHVTAGPRTASRHHRGVEAIDIGVGLGTPIIATHNGLAVAVSSSGPYGNFVDVQGTCSGTSFTTRYGHMVYTAFSGQRLVTKGQVIGYVDSTGNSTGNHLHYEIRRATLGSINQYLPKAIRVGCDSTAECRVNLP